MLKRSAMLLLAILNLTCGSLFAADCSVSGKMVYMQLSSIREIGPIITGYGGNTPSVILYVNIDDWNELTDNDQNDLQCYMPKLVEQVNIAPAKYMDLPQTAPFFKTAMKNVTNLPSNAWEIIVGKINNKGLVNFDQVIAQGR